MRLELEFNNKMPHDKLNNDNKLEGGQGGRQKPSIILEECGGFAAGHQEMFCYMKSQKLL